MTNQAKLLAICKRYNVYQSRSSPCARIRFAIECFLRNRYFKATLLSSTPPISSYEFTDGTLFVTAADVRFVIPYDDFSRYITARYFSSFFPL